MRHRKGCIQRREVIASFNEKEKPKPTLIPPKRASSARADTTLYTDPLVSCPSCELHHNGNADGSLPFHHAIPAPLRRIKQHEDERREHAADRKRWQEDRQKWNNLRPRRACSNFIEEEPRPTSKCQWRTVSQAEEKQASKDTPSNLAFRSDQPTKKCTTSSVCTVCLSRHFHDMRNCCALQTWNGLAARCSRNNKGRLENPDGVELCIDWQWEGTCQSVNEYHYRYECTGCGSTEHGARNCPEAQKADGANFT